MVLMGVAQLTVASALAVADDGVLGELHGVPSLPHNYLVRSHHRDELKAELVQDW